MRIVMTIVGVDRVGIIAKASTLLAENNVNILNINQNIDDGFFNMVLIGDLDNAKVSVETLKEKATALGAKVVTMSDSNGFVHDPNGIDLALVKQLKEVERKRIREYVTVRPEAEYHEGCSGVWQVPCDIALPCATQNELDLSAAKALIQNGCFAVAEGANMPCTPDAVEALQAAGLLFAPAKAANAGGVATSGLEMSQNSERLSWTFEEVDQKLHTIMRNIYHNAANAAAEYGMEGNLVAGANIAGFMKVAKSMVEQGVL